MEYIWAFLIGGAFCVVGQILLDTTPLTAPRILVIFVLLGVLLQAVQLYEPIVKLAGTGATVPLPGFGYSLAKGVEKAVDESGAFGIITGGLRGTAGGITAAMLFSLIASLVFKGKNK